MRFRVLTAVAVVLYTTAGGGGAHAIGPPTVAVGVRADAENLDPARDGSPLTREVVRLVLPALTDQAPDTLAVIPGLAAAWTPSENGLSYTYELRDQLSWSDGKPVTADDVAYSIGRARAEDWPLTGGAAAELEAEVVDERHVLVHSSVADNRLPLLDIPILPRHVAEGLSPDAADGDALRVGAGPFTLSERRPGFVRLVANDRFYNGRPWIDQVTFTVFESGEAQVEALERSEIDIATDLDRALFDRINGNEKITALTVNEGAYWALAIDTIDGNPVLRDARVRRALNLAIDRSVIVDEVLGGVGHNATLPIASRSPLWELDPDEYEGYGFEPGAARELLDAVGLADGDGDGTRDDSAGAPLRLRVSVPADSPDVERAAELAADSLGDVGLAVEVTATDGSEEADRADRADLTFVRRVPAFDPTELLGAFACDEGVPVSGNRWCDPEYDRLFRAENGELDPAGRTELVRRMLLILEERAPEVLLVRPDVLQGYRNDRFRRWVQQPLPDGPVVFSATSPSYLVIEDAPDLGRDEMSAAVLIAGAAGVLGLLAFAVIAATVVRNRRALRARPNGTGRTLSAHSG